MSRDGSGNYSAPASSWNPPVSGAAATAADWTALLADLGAALTQSISKDGQTTPTGNLQMAGYILTGLGAGAATGNSIRYEQLFTTGTVTLLGPMASQLGTAAAPTIAFTGDANTGIYSPGADTVAITTGGSERARVNSTGSLIVGSTAVGWDEQISARSTTSQVMIGSYSTSAAYGSSVYRSQTETAAGTGWQHFQGRAAGGGIVINIYGNGDIQNTNNSYGAISDARLKENITSARNYLDDLARVRVRKFSWKSAKKQSADQIGIMAQELAEVFPGLVTETQNIDETGAPTGETTLGIKYSLLVPMLITAVQELRERVIALESA